MFFVGLVAVATGNVNVLPMKFEVGKRVVEAPFIQIDYVGISAFVVRVTFRAARFRNLSVPAVETEATANVLGYILVTVEAKRILLRAIERLVTGRAFRLNLRMTENHLAGHHQRFDALGCTDLTMCHRHYQ